MATMQLPLAQDLMDVALSFLSPSDLVVYSCVSKSVHDYIMRSPHSIQIWRVLYKTVHREDIQILQDSTVLSYVNIMRSDVIEWAKRWARYGGPIRLPFRERPRRLSLSAFVREQASSLLIVQNISRMHVKHQALLALAILCAFFLAIFIFYCIQMTAFLLIILAFFICNALKSNLSPSLKRKGIEVEVMCAIVIAAGFKMIWANENDRPRVILSVCSSIAGLWSVYEVYNLLRTRQKLVSETVFNGLTVIAVCRFIYHQWFVRYAAVLGVEVLLCIILRFLALFTVGEFITARTRHYPKLLLLIGSFGAIYLASSVLKFATQDMDFCY
jgi:hypothetical protein